MSREPACEGQRRHLELILPADFSRELLQAARQAYRLRADEVLLAALSRVLCAWSEQCCVCLHLQGHGRMPLFDDLDPDRTVGWLSNLYPLRLQPAADLPGSLEAIREQLRTVDDGGLAYGLLCRRGELAGVAPQVLFDYREPGEDEGTGPLRPLDAGLWREADAPLDAPCVSPPGSAATPCTCASTSAPANGSGRPSRVCCSVCRTNCGRSVPTAPTPRAA
ncbi:condensation domain-containing protein [Azorhizophilus paspali]|uniref:condensation domain-containing protein n=1 Tax=Azorhizophilus paspali TaxID=69963 RepID=UPI0036399699